MLHILCYAPSPQKRPNVLSPPPFFYLITPELIHLKYLYTLPPHSRTYTPKRIIYSKKILDTPHSWTYTHKRLIHSNKVLDTPHYCTYTPNGLMHSTKYEILIRTYTLGNNWYYSLLNKKTINLCLTRNIWYYHFPTFTELRLNRPDFFLFYFCSQK